MTFVQTSCLSPEQEAEIRALEETCRQAEPFGHQVFLSNSLNTHPDMDCFFLAYRGDALAGLLALFTPDPGLAEVTALVHPAHRRRGIFTALLSAAQRELDRFGGGDLLFCHEPVCESGGAAVKHLPVELEHTEFLLEYDRGQTPPPAPAGLTLTRAGRAEIPAMTALRAAAFQDDTRDGDTIEARFFDNPAVTPYAARLDGALVGAVYRNTEGGEVYFCALCVDPALQGRGLGRGMLSLALAAALAETEGPIRLEVDSDNMPAYRLYTGVGFRETAREDYYLMKRGAEHGGH